MDTHLHFVIELAKQVRSPMGLYIQNLNLNVNYAAEWWNNIKFDILNAATTRFNTYANINPMVPGYMLDWHFLG